MVYVVQQQHEVKKKHVATRTLVPYGTYSYYRLVLTVFPSWRPLLRWGTWYRENMTRCGDPGCVCCAGYTSYNHTTS